MAPKAEKPRREGAKARRAREVAASSAAVMAAEAPVAVAAAMPEGGPAPAASTAPASAASAPAASERPVPRSGSALPADARLRGLRRLAASLGGARLCYGEPLEAHGRTVIPVARVHGAGGYGFGSGSGDDAAGGGGGGGGGSLEAAPVGFIEIGPDGTRFEAIPDPMGTARALRTAAVALTGVASTVLGARRLSRRRLGR